MSKGPDAFRTISEVGEDLDIPQHVLRFWETRFPAIRPLKRGGGRRYYRPDDVELLRGIRQLLYGQGYTIKGVQRILKQDGLRYVQAVGRGDPAAAALRPVTGADPDEGDGADEPSDGGWDGAEEPAPASRPPAAAQAPAFVGDDLIRLRAALDDLLECRRILADLRGG